MDNKWKKIAFRVAIVIVCFWLIEFLTPHFSLTQNLRQASLELWSYPANYFSHLYLGLSRVGDLFNLSQIKNENLKLKEETLTLRQENEDLKQKLSAFNKCAELLKLYPSLETIPAQVQGFFQEGGRAYLLLAKGKDDGVEINKAVVWGKYLVGKVVEVYPHSAVVETILSRRLVANVYLSDNAEAKGIIRGYLSNGLILEGVPTEFQINQGEIVLTSGLGGVLPPHLIVGKVIKKISSTSEVSQKFLLEPLIDFHNLEVVFVVKR